VEPAGFPLRIVIEQAVAEPAQVRLRALNAE
jgi:hypothetical protein